MVSLYRYYDSDNQLLYIGISLSAVNRLLQHRQTDSWAHKIAYIKIEVCPTREDALKNESLAIQTEKPIHNIRHKKELKQSLPTNNVVDICDDCDTHSFIKRKLLRMFAIQPIYTPDELARLLSTTKSGILRMMDNKELQYIEMEATHKNRQGGYNKVRRVTGWQLIDYIEYKEKENS